MIYFDVDVKSNAELPTAAQVLPWMREAMVQAVAAVERRAKQNLSGRFAHRQTGQGIASVQSRVQVTGDTVTGTVGSPVFYLRILHTGFPKQTITTRKKGFVLFKNGHIIRPKKIQHPGISPRPWLSTAAEDSRLDIVIAFDRVAARIAAGSRHAGTA